MSKQHTNRTRKELMGRCTSLVSGAALIHRSCWGARGSHIEKAAVLARIQRKAMEVNQEKRSLG